MSDTRPSNERVAEFSLVDQMRASINTLHAYHLPLTGDLMSAAAEEIDRLRFELIDLAGRNEQLERELTNERAEVNRLRSLLDAALEREITLAQRCKWYADSQEALRSRVCRQADIDERGGA